MATETKTESPRERSMKEYAERMKGRPTPTQAECDAIKLGEHPEISPDGSGPDLNLATNTVQHIPHTPRSRHMESGSGGAPYKTRDASPSSSKPAAS